MISQAYNQVYTLCSSYGNKFVEFSKPIVSKTVEIAKKCFNSLGHFVAGFCIGAAATACYIIFQNPPMGYSLNLPALAMYATAGGMFVGIGKAASSWRGEATKTEQTC